MDPVHTVGSSWRSDAGLIFAAGFITAVVLGVVIAVTVISSSDVYGLGHWKLNAKMPLTTMWMNLGYWTDLKGERITDFEEACKTLLKEILRTAGLLHRDDSTVTRRHVSILDVGFGCGEQTWELARLLQPESLRYVGLTLNLAQVHSASRKIQRELLSSREQNEEFPGVTSDSFKLHRADAARPDTWSANTKEAVHWLPYSSGESDGDEEVWLLGLDCLYHFRPSRRPLLEFAARKLRSNMMAFDLVLNENASTWDVLVARAVGVMMGCPVKTFLTEDEYREQLVQCGYDRGSVVMRDVTEHVFAPVSEFIERQERALSDYGVSMGGFKLAGRLFSWFARSGVVRAVVVVARRKKQ